MTILAIDTAANLCAACIRDERGVRGRAVRDLGKGHAEHLMAVIGEALSEAGCTYGDLGMIAVSVGPGSFTGIRVGVAAARGLALALSIPAVAVSTLEALAFEARPAHRDRAVLAALDGGRGAIHAALYASDGAELAPPAALDVKEALAVGARVDAVIAGSAADLLVQAAGEPLTVAARAATADIASFAALALEKPRDAGSPAPLYLRGADARIQPGFAVARSAVS